MADVDPILLEFVMDCLAVLRDAPIDVKRVDVLVERFYAMADNGAGCNLHTVLDDTNLEDESIDWALNECQIRNDPAGMTLAYVLRQMPLADRLALASVCDCGCADELRAQAAGRNGNSDTPKV